MLQVSLSSQSNLTAGMSGGAADWPRREASRKGMLSFGGSVLLEGTGRWRSPSAATTATYDGSRSLEVHIPARQVAMRTCITYPTDHVSCTQDELLYTASPGYRSNSDRNHRTARVPTDWTRSCARGDKSWKTDMQHIQLYLLIISRSSLDCLFQAIRQSCLGLS